MNVTEVGLHREGRRKMHLSASSKEDAWSRHGLLSFAPSRRFTRQNWRDRI